jgi:hypothetical protein
MVQPVADGQVYVHDTLRAMLQIWRISANRNSVADTGYAGVPDAEVVHVGLFSSVSVDCCVDIQGSNHHYPPAVRLWNPVGPHTNISMLTRDLIILHGSARPRVAHTVQDILQSMCGNCWTIPCITVIYHM